jgi:DNA (cytosine-5)-methyltransferase 1
MTHGSLFSGIGGIDLGFEWAGIETKWQVEIDDYCQKLLSLRFPHTKKFTDVRKVGSHNLEKVDIVSGGFPCQDISVAGKGAGIEGERSGLWTELHRVISELRPRFAFIENVPMLTIRGGGTSY